MKAVPLRFGNHKNGSEEVMGARNYFVGVDLHRNQFTYCVRYSKGEEKVGKEPIENLELLHIVLAITHQWQLKRPAIRGCSVRF